MEIRGIDERFLRLYKNLLIFDIFVGIITMLLTYILPVYEKELSFAALLSLGALFLITSISFVIVLADLLMKKRIINEIGKDLVLNLTKDSINIKTGDGFSKEYIWGNIQDIEVYERKMFFKRKGKFKVISVISDKETYIDIINKCSERDIKNTRKHEMLQCYFVFQYNPRAIEIIKKHWHGIIVDNK